MCDGGLFCSSSRLLEGSRLGLHVLPRFDGTSSPPLWSIRET